MRKLKYFFGIDVVYLKINKNHSLHKICTLSPKSNKQV